MNDMFFRRKKYEEYPRMWAVVDYCEKAKKLCVGGKQNLRIYIYRGKYFARSNNFTDFSSILYNDSHPISNPF